MDQRSISQTNANDGIMQALSAISQNGQLSYAQFSEVALYHKEHGYYRQPRQRVGREGSDFMTATTLGKPFGKLVIASAANLLAGRDLSTHTFVEIGAEPGATHFDGCEMPFGETLTLRLGEFLEIPPRAVVFANELLDAQPFHRLKRKGGEWVELGVAVGPNGLSEIELPEPTAQAQAIVAQLPDDQPEGWHFDAAPKAIDLLEQLTTQAWEGAILCFDYGRTLSELLSVTPQGSARAYYQHRQSGNLLAHPGDQDLTCHVCWDWLESVLGRNGFRSISVERQEAFLVKQAQTTIGRIMDHPETPMMEKRAIAALLHPAFFGSAFQVLSGVR